MLKDVKKSDKKVERGKDFVVNTKVEATDMKESLSIIKEIKEMLWDSKKSNKKFVGGKNSMKEGEKKEA